MKPSTTTTPTLCGPLHTLPTAPTSTPGFHRYTIPVKGSAVVFRLGAWCYSAMIVEPQSPRYTAQRVGICYTGQMTRGAGKPWEEARMPTDKTFEVEPYCLYTEET